MKTPISAYMSKTPHTIGSEQTLSTAHDLMRKYGIRHLPVLHANKPVGIVSLRDLHLVETLSDVDLEKVPVEEAMTTDLYVVGPDTPLSDVAAVMVERKVGSALVVDGKKVVGVFTTTDALRVLASK
jgi:acetoin utilization protein AcuB